MSDKVPTRLETAQFKFFSPHTKNDKYLRALMDTGSNRSFINKIQAEIMGFPIIKTTSMIIAGFRQNPRKIDCNIVQAKIVHENDLSKNFEIGLIVLKDLIPKIPSYDLSNLQKDFLEKNQIKLADSQAAVAGNLEIDLLLGQDCVRHLMTGDSIPMSDGPSLIPLWDGRFMIAGPVEQTADNDFAASEKPNLIAVNAVMTSIPSMARPGRKTFPNRLMNALLFNVTSEDELAMVESFRSMDALGIGPLDYEISPLLDEFNKTTIFTGERYEVTLPFKKPQVFQLSTNFYSKAKSNVVGGILGC